MTEKELKIRTRGFAIVVLNFVDELPNRKSAHIIGQLAGPGVTLNLLLKSALWKKNPMKVLFGWISSQKQKTLQKKSRATPVRSTAINSYFYSHK